MSNEAKPASGCTSPSSCSDLPWSVFHPDAGDVGLRTPRFASQEEAEAQADAWNRDYDGHVVVGPNASLTLRRLSR
jgi:hypothetical protein